MQCVIFTGGLDRKDLEEEINNFLEEFTPRVVFVTQSESQSEGGFSRTVIVWFEAADK